MNDNFPPYIILKMELPDDMFMTECASRTKDTKKCDYCELRFKCYTQKAVEEVTSSGIMGSHTHSITGVTTSGFNTHLPP